MSHKIITLPKQLANQIAAGEVVERPLSIIKELLENAVDAGATNIEILLENWGIDLIEVRDNWVWIWRDDISRALEKYSTSKINSLEDLHKVMTFGFRWEALASISSVSEFTLSSKTSDALWGKSIFTSGGDTFVESDVAHNVGTRVRVENLFFNTPARLNYLKKPRTEYLKIHEFVQRIALSQPEIAFRLEHNNKVVFDFASNSTLQERIYNIYGTEFSENMLELSHEFGWVHISGFITDPKISFWNKNRQVLFVNGRLIQSPLVFKAISDAYNRFIAHGTYPGYVLCIDLDPTQVDVNVHPRKMELRFAAESTIFRSVYHGVKNILEKVTLVTSNIDGSHWINPTAWSWWNTTNFNPSNNAPKIESYYTGSGTKFKNYSPYKNTLPNPSQAAIDFSKAVSWNDSEDFVREEISSFTTDLHETPLGRIIGQVHNSYILVQTNTWITILDQHAVAERVIYEKLAHSAYTPKMQQILWWIGVNLTASEQELVETYSETFIGMWFEFDILSHNSLMITAIPDFVKKQNIEKIFKEILWDISGVWSKWLEEVRHKIWAYAACRSAVKFGDPLSIFEMNALLRDASMEYSATCPHGRPVVYDIDLEDLQKKYER